MSDNEEPQGTQQANNQIAAEGHKLPEQSRVPQCFIPRPFSFEHLIHQWQPMGIRVVVNTPFSGNDEDFLFAIRNGPFIPRYDYTYESSDPNALKDPEKPNTSPDFKSRTYTNVMPVNSYGFNNMRNVLHAGQLYKKVDEGQNAIYITNFDQPPILASLATMFRKWRGTMHYRIRVVSGFTTQGYVMATLVRNSPAVIGIYPTQNTVGGVAREDRSYREAMINSYVLGDTAMFRHFEVQVPFEYPVPYYDQFNWIGNRCNPANNFMLTWQDNNSAKPVYEVARLRNIRNEPHGDNYILFGLRGKIESSVQNSQVTFELEYRAGDDFQFSDPFLPFDPLYLYSQAKQIEKGKVVKIQVPSSEYYSNGVSEYHTAKQSDNSTRYIPPKIVVTPPTPADVVNTTKAPPPAVQRSLVRNNIRPRLPRSTSEEDFGVDEVDDDLKSEVGDSPDVLDFKRNMRKSLRMNLSV